MSPTLTSKLAISHEIAIGDWVQFAGIKFLVREVNRYYVRGVQITALDTINGEEIHIEIPKNFLMTIWTEEP